MPFHAETARARRIALAALLMTLAALLGYVESVILPTMPVPGLRLGLANIAVVVALATLGTWPALAVSLGRVALVGLATGMIAGPTMFMSAAGALAAWTVMTLARSQVPGLSAVGWSLAGSAANAVAQLVAATFVTGSAAPLMLLPISLGLSIPAGMAIGYAAQLLISRVPRSSLSIAG